MARNHGAGRRLEHSGDHAGRRSTFTRFEAGRSWVILSPVEQAIRRRIEAVGTPLKDWDVRIFRGVLTGCNESFIISGEKKDALVAADPKSAEIIRPILRGRDIKRYVCKFADMWLINTHNGIREKGIPPVDVRRYPAVKAHLDQFYPALARRTDRGVTPYNLRNCAYMEDFSHQKIVWGEISDTSKFSLDNESMVPEATTFFMVGEHLEYLLCMFNSRLGEWMFHQIGTTTGVGTNRWKKYKIESLIIKNISNAECKIFKNFVDDMKYGCTNDIIDNINAYIYKMYNLTDDEIKIIQQYQK